MPRAQDVYRDRLAGLFIDDDAEAGEACKERALAQLRDNPAALARAKISEMVRTPHAVMEQWADETRILGLAAASVGDFKSSFQFYQALGKHYGCLNDKPSDERHLHLHQSPVENIKDASTEELQTRLQRIRAQRERATQSAADVSTEELLG
jgi:hypothetical protein